MGSGVPSIGRHRLTGTRQPNELSVYTEGMDKDYAYRWAHALDHHSWWRQLIADVVLALPIWPPKFIERWSANGQIGRDIDIPMEYTALRKRLGLPTQEESESEP